MTGVPQRPSPPAHPSQAPPPPPTASPTLLQRWYPGIQLSPCTVLRLAGFVPVAVVLCIIFLAYITAVPATLLPLLPRYPAAVYPLLAFFHFVYLNTLANYLLLVLVDPGTPPDDWKAPPPHPHARTSRDPALRLPARLAAASALAEARQLAEEERQRERADRQASDDETPEHETLLVQRRPDPVSDPATPSAAAPPPAPVKPLFRHAHLMLERAYDGSLRYCRVCKAYKPDRTHHCSVCRRCILRMDHHCVFVNNCVSFYNHKFFISFVAYAFVGCLFVAVVSFPTFAAIISTSQRGSSVTEAGGRLVARLRLLVASQRSWLALGKLSAVGGLSSMLKTLAMIGYITSSAFAFALAIFVALHFYLVAKGRTTIEMYELTDPNRAARVAEYDLGAAKNFRNVFGSVPLCWFLPTRAYIEGDGLEWERRVSTDRYAFNV